MDYLDYQSALINKLIQYNKKNIGLLVENLNRRFIETEKSEKRVKLKYLVKLHQDFIKPDPQTLYRKLECTIVDEEFLPVNRCSAQI